MQPLAAASMLDVDGANGAAAAAGLAQGLIQAAVVLLIIGVIGAALVRPHASANPGLIRRIPWLGVVSGAAIVLALGGVVGVWAAASSASIIRGNGIGAALSGDVAGWSIAAIVVASLAMLVAKRGRISLAIAGLGAVVVLVGMSTTSELPRPAEQVQATATVSPTVQATIVVEPGAAGGNEVRLGLSGPAEDIARLRASVADGEASVSFRSLALGVTSPERQLSVDEEGALVASDVVLESDGRWRAQFELGGLDTPIVADMTMQSNPGYDA